jgi:hypothetical protein
VGDESVVAPEVYVAFTERPGASAWLYKGVIVSNVEVLAATQGKEES